MSGLKYDTHHHCWCALGSRTCRKWPCFTDGYLKRALACDLPITTNSRAYTQTQNLRSRKWRHCAHRTVASIRSTCLSSAWWDTVHYLCIYVWCNIDKRIGQIDWRRVFEMEVQVVLMTCVFFNCLKCAFYPLWLEKGSLWSGKGVI